MIESRLEEVHGPNGLVSILTDQASMLSRVRLLNQYSDYLPVSLERLRTESCRGSLWSDSDWIQVAEVLDTEDTLLTKARERQRR
jgi:hypothetical protein